ncbi:MAG: GNAT family protein [Pseudomonadota bacterium]
MHTTPLGDPIGAPLPEWHPCPLPPRAAIKGRHIRLEPQTLADHGDDLWAAFSAEPSGADWTHRLNGPYTSRADFDAHLRACEHSADLMYFAYVDIASGKALGNGAFMSMLPAVGAIEVGSIMFSRALQRTRAATEAIFLHMKWAFEAGYRRFEWTCDPLNAASMGAAERFGFQFETMFRQAYVAKGRNRDKAVFSIIDAEWPGIKAAFETWLDDANFGGDGLQKQSLRTLTAPLVSARAEAEDRGLRNDLGQAVDHPVENWRGCKPPTRMTIPGRYCRLEALHLDHAEGLFNAHTRDAEGRNWTYMPGGPYASVDEYRDWVWTNALTPDPQHYTIITDEGPVGTASLMRIDTANGSIETGHVAFSPLLQRTRAATECIYLFMDWSFAAGYRRFEWKCNALNAPSRRAAQRFGMNFEGIWRQAVVTKGANRDTAWYAATDKDWPALKSAFQTWLDPANFDDGGQQRESLSALTQPLLTSTG